VQLYAGTLYLFTEQSLITGPPNGPVLFWSVVSAVCNAAGGQVGSRHCTVTSTSHPVRATPCSQPCGPQNSKMFLCRFFLIGIYCCPCWAKTTAQLTKFSTLGSYCTHPLPDHSQIRHEGVTLWCAQLQTFPCPTVPKPFLSILQCLHCKLAFINIVIPKCDRQRKKTKESKTIQVAQLHWQTCATCCITANGKILKQSRVYNHTPIVCDMSSCR